MLILLIFIAASATLVRAEAPDTSTPKKAGVAFAKAVQTGDLTTAKTLATGTDSEWSAVKALSDLSVAMKSLEAAVTKKFGADGKFPEGMLMDVVADFQLMEEKIEGDQATLISKIRPDDKFPPTLKKVGSGWKMDLSNMSQDAGLASIVEAVPLMLKRLKAVIGNVESGKYPKFADVMAAMTSEKDPE